MRKVPLSLLSLPGIFLAASLLAWPAALSAAPPPPPLGALFSGDFTLTDQDGRQRRSREFRGRFVMIFFGYTHCPAICPTNLQHMANALRILGPDAAQKIQPVFITIDPARDRPAVLKEYMSHFGDNFIGLTGTEAQIRDVARKYRVHRRKVVEKDRDPASKDYLVDHSSLTLLLGPDGKFRTLFPHDTDGEIIAKRVKNYLN